MKPLLKNLSRRCSNIIPCLLAVVFLAAILTPLARAAEDEITNEQLFSILNELKAQNQNLQKELKQQKEYFEHEIKILKERTETGPVSEKRDDDQHVEDFEDISEIVTTVERKSLMDKILWNVELRTRVDWFDYKEHASPFAMFYNYFGQNAQLFDALGLNKRRHLHERVNAVFSNRLRLKMKVELTNNVQFHGRLLMQKNWIDDDITTFPQKNIFNTARVNDDSGIYVERAYVDYFFQPHEKLPMALSFGMLPYTDGMPVDFRENSPRASTWPALAWDASGSGVGLTMKLDKLTGLPQSAFRFVYIRRVSDNNDNVYREDLINVDELTPYIFQFETGLPYTWADQMLFLVNLLYFPDMPSYGFEEISFMRPLDLPSSLGSFWKLTFFVQSKRFLGSMVDWFAGFSYMETNSNGNVAQYRMGPTPFKASLGLMNSDGEGDRSARSFHLGVRLNLPWPLLNNPKFGIEYNKGSRYWWGLNAGPEDPLHKLDNRGYAWDFYWIQPINRNLFARVGYTYVRKQYGGMWYMGDAFRTHQRITNLYLLMDASF